MYHAGVVVEKNIFKAFELYQASAAQGDSTAQCRLGDMYHAGEGVEKNLDKAFDLYQKSSEQGNPKGQWRLGFMYYYGGGVEKNFSKAFDLYQKSATKENSNGQWCLGSMYYSGDFVEKDISKAFELYQKSSDQENTEGQWRLGQMYQLGKGVEKDISKAFELYQKSAAKENSNGQWCLGDMYLSGEGVKKDISKAIELYQKSADQENPQGQWRLGHMYQFGRGVEKDFAKAFELFQKSADQGNAIGQWHLGDMYEFGEGVEKDLAKAVELYQRSADQGESYPLFVLAEMYENGYGVYRSLSKAVELYHKACENDDNIFSQAAYRLGYAYYDGEGVEQNKETALEYFQKAYDYGYSCSYAIDMVKFELSEKQINKKSAQDGGDNLMRVYAEEIIKDKNFSTTLPMRVLKDLEKDFADTWQLLDKKTKDSLFTAILFYVQTYSYGPSIYGNIDFAPTINGICKALEIELGKILYTGYVKYLIDQNINPNSFPKKRGFLKQVSAHECTYNKAEDVSKFTLGNLKYIVGLDKEISVEAPGYGSEKNRRQAKNKIDKTMIEYISYISKEESFGYLEERAISEYIIYLTQEVGSIADSLRNPASHSEIMKCARAEVCGNYVIKVKKILMHFLEKIDIDKFNELLNKKDN